MIVILSLHYHLLLPYHTINYINGCVATRNYFTIPGVFLSFIVSWYYIKSNVVLLYSSAINYLTVLEILSSCYKRSALELPLLLIAVLTCHKTNSITWYRHTRFRVFFSTLI